MFRVIILFAPDNQDIINPVNDLKAAFENEKCRIEAKAVKNAMMPDIAASEIVILGSKSEGKNPVHTDFKEIIRALQGINLAGKIAGIFYFGNEETVVTFKQALQDSDIVAYEKSLLIEDGKSDSTIIVEWVKNIITCYKDGK